MKKWPQASVLLASFVLIAGCGGGADDDREPVYPVSGVITYNGAPVAGADVTFTCTEQNSSAFGRTDEQGRFKLTSFAPNDGAVAGKHVIVVTKITAAPAPKPVAEISSPDYQPPKEGESTDPEPPKNSIPARYASAKTSDLFAVVVEGKNPEMTLELKD